MLKTTPFHQRLAELNESGLWTHWAGHLSALRYGTSAKHEYFAVRNSVGLLDTSPLFKYWVRGGDAERFLAGVLTRDVRRVRPGYAAYTVWCDDRGFVLEDGVVLRHSEREFLLTSARPNLGYLDGLVGRLDVELEDVSDDYGVLALQGPRAREVLSVLAPQAAGLQVFELCHAKVGSTPVTVSRTGYTGDLGYELWVDAADGLPVLDRLLEAGLPRGLRPYGEQAMAMLRIEAGLLLIDVDFTSSRLAYTDQERFTPAELGLRWMLRGIDASDRPFIGRDAIRAELADKTSRWSMVGLQLDWRDYDRLHARAGLIAPKDENPLPYESMVYAEGQQVGYATSLMYSPVLQRHIALARVRPACAAPGSRVDVELTVDHAYHRVAAQVSRLPHFNPDRRTA